MIDFQLSGWRGSNPIFSATPKKKFLLLVLLFQKPLGLCFFFLMEGDPNKNEHLRETVFRKAAYLPIRVGCCSFQFWTMMSQVRSGRRRWRVASLGFLVLNKKPRCLNVTISPLWGFHRFTNSVVPAAAVKRIPLGLKIRRKLERAIYRNMLRTACIPIGRHPTGGLAWLQNL